MMPVDQRPILIAGPTASGKSALALGLAERLGGVIINADSMQVYRELRILTARPSNEDERRAPHLLYGFVAASEAYSSGRYMRDVAKALEDVRSKALRPILVGGTGLYFKAILGGLSPMPPVADAVRTHWREEAARCDAATLHAELSRRDPIMAARLMPTDTQRIVRALEVLDSTGRSLALWQSQPGVPVVAEQDCVTLLMLPDRHELRARADARFSRMLEEGALQEAERVAALELSAELPAMRAIGVGPLIAAARGELELHLAVQRAQAETRQYLKRQETWLMRNMIAWNNCHTQYLQNSIDLAMSFVQGKR